MARENLETYGLAALGAAEGVFHNYVLDAARHATARVRKPRPSNLAWLTLAAGVVAYDLKCPPGETMSEGVDRGLEKLPVLTSAAIGMTTLHLMNMLPPDKDPFVWFMKRFKH